MVQQSKIGDINGKWSVLFRVVLAVNALLIPALITWGAWVTMTLVRIDYEMQFQTNDRLTGAMFIDIQDELKLKNPTTKWLDAKEVREIQKRNWPYR